MPTFELILPEGRLLLRRPDTGETLTISADNGPVSLGSVELALELRIGRAAAPESVTEKKTQSGAEAERVSCVLPAPGLDPAVLARLAVPSEAPFPPQVRSRVLDAPMEALTAHDFDEALAALVARRTSIEGEIDFMREIDGDPDDIAEMERTLSAVTDEIQATNRRLEAWRAVQRALDKQRGAQGA